MSGQLVFQCPTTGTHVIYSLPVKPRVQTRELRIECPSCHRHHVVSGDGKVLMPDNSSAGGGAHPTREAGQPCDWI